MGMANNVIVRLIESKMTKDNWDAWTPDSYASYLWNLTDEEIIEAVENDNE